MESWFVLYPLFIVLVISTYTDLRWRLIFNWLTIPGMFYFLLINALCSPKQFLVPICGLFILGGLSLVLTILSKGQLGGGDIKLFALLGAAVGWKVGLTILGFTFITATVFALFLSLYFKWIRKAPIPKELPMAPFLLIATSLFYLSSQSY